MNDQSIPDSVGLHRALTPLQEAGLAGGQPANVEEQLASLREEVRELRASLRGASAREQILRDELQHRVRNMLAVIRSVFRRTRESGVSQDELADHFEGRLDVIARYQSAFGEAHSVSMELEDIVRSELFAVGCSDGPMCEIAGPAVMLGDKAVELLGLAMHELTTNSVKFGALAHRGKISVRWKVNGAPPQATTHLRWTETGVSVVATAPRPKGFGRQLIEEALPYQLGATTSFELKPGGLDCSIVLPLSIPVAVPDRGGSFAAQDPLIFFPEPE